VTLKDPEGNISSPGYPQPYPSYTSCQWDIIAEEKHYIQLVFTDMHFKRVLFYTDIDHVSVKDGLGRNDRILMRISRTVLTSVAVASSGRTMSVKFISYEKDKYQPYRGFRATYKAISLSKLLPPIPMKRDQ
jgi:hypothetical protein